MAEKFDYEYTAELRLECFKHIYDPLRQKDASTIFTNYFDDICDTNELAIGRG